MSTDAPWKSASKGQTRPAGNFVEVNSIAHTAQLCLKSFNVCLEVAETLGPKRFALIQNQLGRLSLWISNIGVFATDRASIDYRLRDVPDTHRLVKGLVEVLNGNLEKCIPRLESLVNLIATVSEDANERIETEDSEFEAVVQRVAADIGLLYQLSNTIRKAGRESQNSKASSLFEIKDAEGNNMENILEAQFLHNLTDKFPGCDALLRKRLATTILVRRKRILYRRSRRPKAPAPRLPLVSEPEVRRASGTHIEVKRQERGLAEPHTFKHKPSMIRSQARTTKTTTTLDPERLRPPTAPSVLSVAKTIPLNSHDDLVFPPPPRAAILERFRELKAKRRERHNARLFALPNFELYVAHQGKPPSLPADDVLCLRAQIKEAERDLQVGIDIDLKLCKNATTEVMCPYCLCALSNMDMKSKGKWREHLRGDLDAYVCLFPDCEKPYELYNHSDTWLKHMRQHAVRWQCMAKSHGPQTFEQSDEYGRHLRESHKGVFSESQIMAMTERNARMMGPLFQSCPLCGATKDHPTVTGRLEDHVVGHLRNLALSSLPYIEEEEQKTNSTVSLKSDDSAKPADRSTVHDLMDEELDSNSEDSQTTVVYDPFLFHSGEDPYAEWNGIEDYVRASHTLRPGEPPRQMYNIPTGTFPCPQISESTGGYESYLQHSDDSSRFVDAHDISEESLDIRNIQWGYIPMINAPYEGQEADPILQEFRRHAVSNTLPTELTTSSGTSASGSVSPPVRQKILEKFASAKISPTGFPSFVPMDTLTEMINAETVSMALSEAGRLDLSSERCTNIAHTLPRVFAALLLIDNITAILDFQLRGFTDDIFPLLRADAPPEGREAEFKTWYSTIYTLSKGLSDGIHPVSTCFQDPSLWTLDKFKRFHNSQWLFSAPVFEPGQFDYLLAPQSPLPFTTVTKDQSGGLPYSQVYIASIHPAHLFWQNTLGTELSEVAVKIVQIRPNGKEDLASNKNGRALANAVTTARRLSSFAAESIIRAVVEDSNIWAAAQEANMRAIAEEANIMAAMQTIKHDHLLQVTAAFVRGRQYGFIMPRAIGSLRTLCETQDHSKQGLEKITSWLFTQLLGITDGLAKLHEHRRVNKPLTRHGALNPDNILWFPGHESDPDAHPLGVLIIGDRGQPVGSSSDTSLRDTGSRYVARESPPSPFDDTWSLGLIFFEFVIWMIRGKRQVRDFRLDTSFVHQSDTDDYRFEQWSDNLMNDQRHLADTPLGGLVKFIVRRLLVPLWDRNLGRYRATALEFHYWVSGTRSQVIASGGSYT